MKNLFRAAALAFALIFGAAFLACTGEPEAVDPAAAFERILSEVTFAAPLEDETELADYMFGDVPEGTEIRFYAAGGQYADTAMLFKAPSEADIPAVRDSAGAYIASLKEELRLYHPEEVPKLENAVFHQNGSNLIVVVTEDTETVSSILHG